MIFILLFKNELSIKLFAFDLKLILFPNKNTNIIYNKIKINFKLFSC